MAPKRRLDERRRSQNREAQRRYREKIRRQSQQDDAESQPTASMHTGQPVSPGSSAASYSSAVSSSSVAHIRTEQASGLPFTADSTVPFLDLNAYSPLPGNALQGALMASLAEMSREMDRCDALDLRKRTAVQPESSQGGEAMQVGSSMDGAASHTGSSIHDGQDQRLSSMASSSSYETSPDEATLSGWTSSMTELDLDNLLPDLALFGPNDEAQGKTLDQMGQDWSQYIAATTSTTSTRDEGNNSAETDQAEIGSSSHTLDAVIMPVTSKSITDAPVSETNAWMPHGPMVVEMVQVPNLTIEANRFPFPMARMHFRDAIMSIVRRMGLSIDYLFNPASISTVKQGWLRRDRVHASPPRLVEVGDVNALWERAQTEVTCGALEEWDTSRASSQQWSHAVASSTSFAKRIKQRLHPSTATQLCEVDVDTDDSTVTWRWDSVSPSMHPTQLQLTTTHHPYVDISFPWASMRDKVLLMAGIVYDERALCSSALYSQTTGVPSFTVWGDDASNEMAWEVSEDFAKQWWFLLDDKILRQTNWWRAQRGVRPIVEEKIPK